MLKLEAAMHIEQFEYILEVAKTGSIINASKNLHVSPSAVSQSISHLEDELGVKIFSRSRGKNAVPTDEGKLIIKQAVKILMDVQELKEIVNPSSPFESGEIKLSTITGIMPFLMKAMYSFKEDYPHMDIQIIESNTEEIINDVKQHKIDMGLIVANKWNIDGDLRSEVLLKSKMRIYVNGNSVLSSYKRVNPQELLNYPFVLYKDDYFKWFTQELFRDLGEFNVVFTSSNADVIKNAVVEGIGITLVTDYYLKNDPYVLDGRIIPLEIATNKEITDISIFLIWSKGKHLPSSVYKFVEHVKSYLL